MSYEERRRLMLRLEYQRVAREKREIARKAAEFAAEMNAWMGVLSR